MKTRFCIPQVLLKYSDGENELTVDGDTVREILENVESDYPALFGCICDETGKLRPHVNLFLNNELLVDASRFSMAVDAGDVISVFQSVSGG